MLGPGDRPLTSWQRAHLAALHQRFHDELLLVVADLSDDDPELVEDVVQETWAAAAANLGPHTPLAGPGAWGWLQRTATRLAVESRMARDRLAPLSGPEGEAAAAAGVADDAERTALRLALQSLGQGELRLLYGRDVEGRGRDELARSLAIEPAAVSRLLAQVRQRLRDEYLRVLEVVGRLGVVQGIRHRWRRLRMASQRVGDDRFLTPLRVELLPSLGSVVTSAVVGVSLAGVVMLGAQHRGGHERGDAAAPPLLVVVDEAAGGGALPARPPHDDRDGAPVQPPAAPLPVAVTVSTAVGREQGPAGTDYRLNPAAGTVDDSGDGGLLQGGEGRLEVPLTFACPPPEHRAPVPAVGCLVLEEVAR